VTQSTGAWQVQEDNVMTQSVGARQVYRYNIPTRSAGARRVYSSKNSKNRHREQVPISDVFTTGI